MERKTKYSPGDRVVVRSDLRSGVKYFMYNSSVSDVAISEMLQFAGKTVEIESISNSKNKYRIKECKYWWTDGMFIGMTSVIFDDSLDDADVSGYQEYITAICG